MDRDAGHKEEEAREAAEKEEEEKRKEWRNGRNMA
jgi:hypothetical protein